MAISSILSNSDNGGILYFLFFFWLSNQLENEDRLLQYVLDGNVLYLNALLSSCSSQFLIFFLVSKCWLQKSSHQLLRGGINIATHWLAYIHSLCLAVTFVKFLKIVSLSKKASSVFLLANGYLSSVLYFSKF